MRMASRALGVLVWPLLVAGALAACGPSLAEEPPVVGVTEIAVRDNAFAPRVIQVEPGTEVSWDWAEAGRGHNVVGDGFSSDVQSNGTFRHTFAVAGTYDYLCTLHGGMRGRVIVTESPAAGTGSGSR